VSNDNEDAKINFTFAKGSTALISASANAKFNSLSYEKVKALEGEDDAADLFLNGNTTIQIGNAKIAAHGDYQKINAETRSSRDQEPNYSTYFSNIKYPDYEDYNNNDAYDEAVAQYSIAYNMAWKKYRSDYEKYDKTYYASLVSSLNKHIAYAVINIMSDEILSKETYDVD